MTFLRRCFRDHAVGFDVELLLRAGFVGFFDDEVGTLKGCVDVAVLEVEGLEGVGREVLVGPDDGRVRDGFFDSEDGGFGGVGDGDCGYGFGEALTIRVSEQQDGFVGVVDTILCQ